MKKARSYLVAVFACGLVWVGDQSNAIAQFRFRVGNTQFQFGSQGNQGRPGGYRQAPQQPGMSVGQGISGFNAWNRPQYPRQAPYRPGNNLFPQTTVNNWNRPYYPQGQMSASRSYVPSTRYRYSESQASAFANGSNGLRLNSLPSYGPSSSPRAKIINPADSGGNVHYTVNGQSFTIRPGEAQDLARAQSWLVQFDRGTGSGDVRYRLTDGVYRFKPTDSGWELYHTDEPL